MIMDVQKLSAVFSVRKLCESDAPLVFELMRKHTLFYQYHPPFVTQESILQDMRALPPGKSPDDKYYLGFFQGEHLLAVMDLILGYPDAETAYIGLFMVDAPRQGQGLGSAIIRDCAAQLRAAGYRSIRLGVDKGNPQSLAFWRKNGFETIAEKQHIIMELSL